MTIVIVWRDVEFKTIYSYFFSGFDLLVLFYQEKSKENSSAYGIRTRVTGVRGQRPKPLDERAIFYHFLYRYSLIVNRKSILKKITLSKGIVRPGGLEPPTF